MSSAQSSEIFQQLLRPVRRDIDDLGHVSNLVYVRWIQDGARAHSDACGYDLAAYQEMGAVFVVRRHEVDYRAPVFLDEALVLSTKVVAWRGASSVRETEIQRRSDGVVVCQAKTHWAFVDLQTGRPTRIPQAVQDAFARP